MATRITIETAARTELQELTAGFWAATELHSWFDEANAEITSKTKQEATATITMVAGTESYSLPTDFFLARRVELQTTPGSASNWMFLQPLAIDFRDPGDLLDTTTQTGTPYGWYIFGTKIYFTPIPNGAYSGTLFYVKNAVASTSDSDTPSYPNGIAQVRVDNAIKKYIVASALLKRQDPTYAIYAGGYTADVSAIESDAAKRGSATPPIVVNDWWAE
jgi:hypothetical protein